MWYYYLSASQVEACRTGLQASLLVQHQGTKQLFVNFDPLIMNLFREADCMTRMNLDVPQMVEVIRDRQASFKVYQDRLNVCPVCLLTPDFFYLQHAFVFYLSSLDSVFCIM